MNDLIRALADLMPEKIFSSRTGYYRWKMIHELPVQIEGPYAGITLYAVLEYVRALSEEQQYEFSLALFKQVGKVWQPDQRIRFIDFHQLTPRMAVETLLEVT